MTEKDIQDFFQELGLVLDEGNLISGPYIPMGYVRIYAEEEPYNILGEGNTVEEAYKDFMDRQESTLSS